MNLHGVLLVAVMAGVTIIMRFIPFWIFPEGKPVPEWIRYLGNTLPMAIIGLLVLYCLRNTVVTQWPYGLPELISVILVVALHLWKRSTILSILAGTVCYMALIQFVFA